MSMTRKHRTKPRSQTYILLTRANIMSQHLPGNSGGWAFSSALVKPGHQLRYSEKYAATDRTETSEQTLLASKSDEDLDL